MPGDNLGMLQSSTRIDAKLKKKEQAISFHTVSLCHCKECTVIVQCVLILCKLKTQIREAVAAGIINPIKVGTEVNVADFLTKSLAWKEHHYHSGVFFGRWDFGKEQNMLNVKLRTLTVKGKRTSRSYCNAPVAKRRRRCGVCPKRVMLPYQ
jgi:hypothetical protein